jgi:hypothetical protein
MVARPFSGREGLPHRLGPAIQRAGLERRRCAEAVDLACGEKLRLLPVGGQYGELDGG